MKRFLLVAICCFTFSFSYAITKTWNVSGSGLWNVGGNWSPAGVPGPADDVVIDGIAVFAISPMTITLPNTAVSVNSITISNALATITLLLPASNTLTPGLTVTGAGDAFVLNTQTVFQNASGATTGSAFVITNTLRINNGGQYLHDTRSDAASLLSHLSTVAGTEFGEFRYDVPGGGAYAVTMNNVNTYGTLQFYRTGGAITYTATGAGDCNIRGNFFSQSLTTLSISMTGNINIAGSMDGWGVVDMQTGSANTSIKIAGGHYNSNGTGSVTESGTGLPILEFNGTSQQFAASINTQCFFNSITLKVNNPAGLIAIDQIYVPYKFDFTLGKVDLNSMTSLIFMDNATYTNASTLSFAENGQVKKIGDELFAFPVGAGGIFAPIIMNTGVGQTITDEFVAEYKRTNPQSVHGAAVQGGQDHTSYVEYWTLNRILGSATKFVLLSVNFTSFCKDLTKTYVSRWNGTFWTAESTTPIPGPTLPPYVSGVLVSNLPFNSFGDFTLITDQPFAANPLPIKLISFAATKLNKTTSSIKWELSDVCSQDADFEIQKSINGRDFSPIKQVAGNVTSKSYTTQDNQLSKGITYYRLKMTDYDGTVTYSHIVVLINDSPQIVITSVSPNPVHNTTVLTITSSRYEGINFSVYDLSGKIAKEWYCHVQDGINKIPVDFSDLPAGVYQLVGSTNGSRNVIQFVKQ